MQADNLVLKATLNIITNGSDALYESLKIASNGILDIDRINKLSIDSRDLTQSAIFVALFGESSNGHDYRENALITGCKLMLVESADSNAAPKLKQVDTPMGPHFEIEVYQLSALLADICSCFYALSDELEILAITGTNGKTSVANICAQLLSFVEKSSATIGTLGVQTYLKGQVKHLKKSVNTTPDVVTLHATINALLESGTQNLAIEASSHGLFLKRLGNLPVKCAIFTNLTQDHLDFHSTMADYASSKRLLLNAPMLAHVVLNADDPESEKWAENVSNTQQIYWYSVKQTQFFEIGEKQGCWVSNIEYTTNGSAFTLHSSWGSQAVQIGLIGEFNIANVLAAMTSLLALGYPFEFLYNHLHLLSGVAGRMELFPSAKASILVDYAHTPDALKQALLAARTHTTGKLYCVFGCGGDRDNSKRAMMGSVAEQFADYIFLTQDNSRSESPGNIIEHIQQGISDINKVTVELNREQAIAFAWHRSGPNDMLLVAGKGHEDYMEAAGNRHYYNERDYVKKLTQPTIVKTKQSEHENPEGTQS